MSPAKLAGIGGAASNPVMLGFLLALQTEGHAIGPALISDMRQASVIVGELGVEVIDGVPQMSRDRLLNCDVFPSGHV